MSLFSFILVCVLVLRPSLVAAHGAVGMAGMMLPYLHFTPGDILWFAGWVPQSASSMVGTCIGMFLLGLVDRWVAVCASVISSHWDKQAQILQSSSHLVTRASHTPPVLKGLLSPKRAANPSIRVLPPFILSHEFPRGIIQVGQSALKFALMLAVMSFNVGIIISVVFGLGVGEMLFGRFSEHDLSY